MWYIDENILSFPITYNLKKCKGQCSSGAGIQFNHIDLAHLRSNCGIQTSHEHMGVVYIGGRGAVVQEPPSVRNDLFSVFKSDFQPRTPFADKVSYGDF